MGTEPHLIWVFDGSLYFFQITNVILFSVPWL
jgi:hypothetical protein